MQATVLPGDGSTPDLELLTDGESRPSGATVLFVHGLGHDASCWRHWMKSASQAGYSASAVSLRGHGGSGNCGPPTRLSHYVYDVVRAAEHLGGRRLVLVGHSLGGLVVQKAAARLDPAAVVLVASMSPWPAIHTVAAVMRHQPLEAARYVVGLPVRFAPRMLFRTMDAQDARAHCASLSPEPPLVQYQILFHAPPPAARTTRFLSVISRADRVVPVRSGRSTARRYGGEVVELAGIGHDLMLDSGWERGWDAVSEWLSRTCPAASHSTRDEEYS